MRLKPKKARSGKTFLFVDGTNLYAGQYELLGPDKYLVFSLFIKEIESKTGISFDKIYFYASYSPRSKNPTKREKLYLKNEALFYRGVRETKGVVFFTGYRSKASGKEKEVDVKLTADLISFAFLNKFNTVYLFTGDADFLQALFNIKKFHDKKNIYLICLENKIMYKGAFYFGTYIVSLRKVGQKFHNKQKIKILKIDESEVVRLLPH